MKLYARCDRERKRRQTLREHSRNVADFCGDACRDLGLSALGKLTGLLHDMGKAAAEFQNYLEKGDRRKEERSITPPVAPVGWKNGTAWLPMPPGSRFPWRRLPSAGITAAI